MATDRQIAANRRNGSLGRGPKTSAGKARSSRNALKHGLSIPVNRDKTLRRQIELLARILAQSEAGNVFGQARAAAEAELELASSPPGVRRKDCPRLGKPGPVLFSGGTRSRGRR